MTPRQLAAAVYTHVLQYSYVLYMYLGGRLESLNLRLIFTWSSSSWSYLPKRHLRLTQTETRERPVRAAGPGSSIATPAGGLWLCAPPLCRDRE